MNNQRLQWLIPNWPAPTQVHAISTMRYGGVSSQPYCSLNLGDHVGDDRDKVELNRTVLKAKLNLPHEPLWLKQVHSNTIIPVHDGVVGKIEADGSFTNHVGQVCVVLTADCLPILLTNKAGTTVAAIHAGWRGLANGIIDIALKSMQLPSETILAWFGPAIGPKQFEVGDDVKEIFSNKAYNSAPAFESLSRNKWLLDIYALARYNLQHNGVKHIYGGDQCTFTQADRYFSYRRDGMTGRMASLIWIDR